MTTTIYHNPRCSKSRLTLAMLEEKGLALTIVRYLESAPNRAQLLDVAAQLDGPVTSMIRFNEQIAKDLGLSQNDDRSDAQWCELLSQHPIMIQRPIVIHKGRAAIGRPPELVLSLFE